MFTIDFFKNKHQHIRNKYKKKIIQKERDLTSVEGSVVVVSHSGVVDLKFEREFDEGKAMVVVIATSVVLTMVKVVWPCGGRWKIVAVF